MPATHPFHTVAGMRVELFSEYDTGDFYDEMFDARGHVRPHYTDLVSRLAKLGAPGLTEKDRQRDSTFRTRGVTFAVADDHAGVERTFPMDLIPRVIPPDEWRILEAGLIQRVRALNLFLDDI